MAHLYTSFTSATDTGNVYLRDYTDTIATEIYEQQSLDRRPSVFKYRNRTYIVGQFPRMLVYNEYGQLTLGGIIPPNEPPTVSNGAQSGGSTGIARGYLTFLQKQGQAILQESDPSEASDELILSGTGRIWDDLTAPQDARVTHMRGYLEVDGEVPALAWERPIGVTQVTENVLTENLGETLPVFTNPLDGQVDFDHLARGVPPYCQFAEVYHESTYYSGDPIHPERIYKSRIREPESVNSTESIEDSSSGFLVTPDGEAVTGLRRWDDLLIVTGLRTAYAIQGYDSGDLSIIKISDFYGCVSNAAMIRVGPKGDLYAPGQECVWKYDGTFHDLMDDTLAEYWSDTYRANAATFQQTCFAAENRAYRQYLIQTPKPADQPAAIGSWKWVAHWEPVSQGGQPWWCFFARGRSDSIMGPLLSQNNSTFLDFYTGSCDGIVRRENVETNGDDDGDEYAKRFEMATKHYFFGDQCGDDSHGRTYTDLDCFVKNENNPVNVELYGGDDTAFEAANPQWDEVIPAGAVTTPVALVPKTSTHFARISGISGKGVTVYYWGSNATDVAIRGFAIYHTDGIQERPLA